MQDTKAKVLVVDDDPALLTLLVDTLQTVGYDVTAAPGGVPALDRLAHEKFDLMVTDIKMPDIDGIQLLKKVRRHYPGMPVLFITGFATPEIIGHASPDGFLAKPFRIQHIEELIERTLSQKSDPNVRTVRKVLVIDHDDNFRVTLTEALNYSQYIPFAAADEAEAMRELENGNFDAVIADIANPHFDSATLTQLMRARYPQTPVIAVGADDGSLLADNQQMSLYAGYLQKPFNLGSMLELLEKVTPSMS